MSVDCVSDACLLDLSAPAAVAAVAAASATRDGDAPGGHHAI